MEGRGGAAARRLGPARGAALIIAFAAVLACSPRDERSASEPARVGDDLAMAQSGAASVLRDIGAAREAAQRDQPLVAEWDVERADRRLDGVEQRLPDAEPLARLWLAREEVEYESPQAALPDLDVLSVVVDEIEARQGPLPSVRRNLHQARQSIERGDGQAARRALDAVADELSTQTEGLPFDSTRRLLADARVALLRGDLPAADAALRGAGAIMASFVQVLRSPRQTARWSLDRAAEAMASGEPALARRRLELARSSLERLAAQSDYAGRRQAADLALDLERLARAGAGARSEIAALAERVRGLPGPEPAEIVGVASAGGPRTPGSAR